MKVIVTSAQVITPSKDFVGKEDELAAKLGLLEYQIIDAADAPDLTPDSVKVAAQIAALEYEITPRRLREAVLTAEGKTWLTNKEAEIEALRA